MNRLKVVVHCEQYPDDLNPRDPIEFRSHDTFGDRFILHTPDGSEYTLICQDVMDAVRRCAQP